MAPLAVSARPPQHPLRGGGPPADGELEDGPARHLGWIAPEVADEFPQLALVHCDLPLPAKRRSPRAVREQLAALSDRHRGATALALRREPVAAAYRIFFRHIGLEPDVTRTPIEAAVLERLLRGAFVSRDLLADALLLALVQTSVPVWALDARRRAGSLGIRPAGEGERLGHRAGAHSPRDGVPSLVAGRLVVADEAAAVGVLFDAIGPEHAVGRDTERVTLFAVQVAGVPSIHVEEALWVATSTIAPT